MDIFLKKTFVHTMGFDEPIYEWDPHKAETNLRKHGVSFAEAITALFDERALTREDPDAEGEQRFVTLGSNDTGVLLVVVFTHRGSTYRLISARKANTPERRRYEET